MRGGGFTTAPIRALKEVPFLIRANSRDSRGEKSSHDATNLAYSIADDPDWGAVAAAILNGR